MSRVLSIVLLVCLLGCHSTATQPASSSLPAESTAPTAEAPVTKPAQNAAATGAMTRQQILGDHEDWRAAFMQPADLDAQAAARLKAAPEGMRIKLVLGTWCSDSRREVTRFWQAEEMQGGEEAMPFAVEMVAIDRAFSAPGFDKEALGVVAVPTFIVYKGEEEVGRLVEVAETSVEADLAALLHGEKSGTIRRQR